MTETRYYRTAKGSHIHQNYECANQRRAIASGTPTECSRDEMAPCEHCMPTGIVTAHAEKVAAAADAKCIDMGAKHPKRIQSECRTCGKPGKVNRRNGQIRH